MYIPHTTSPTVSSGGEKGSGKVPAKWNSREYIPFYSIKVSDHVDETECYVCEAPIRTYEVEEHELACLAIANSNGKDKPIRKVEVLEPDPVEPESGSHPSQIRTRPGH